MKPGTTIGTFDLRAEQLQPIAAMFGWDTSAFEDPTAKTIGLTAGSYLLNGFEAAIVDPLAMPEHKALAHEHLAEYYGADYPERLTALEKGQAKRGLIAQMLARFSIFQFRERNPTSLGRPGQLVPDVSD